MRSACTFSVRSPGRRMRMRPSTDRSTNCGRPRPPAPGWSRLCSPWRICIWCITSTNNRSTLFASCRSVFPTDHAPRTPTGRRRGSPCAWDETTMRKSCSTNRLRCIPEPTRPLPPCIGGRAWRKRITSPAWLAPITRSCPTASVIITMPNWGATASRNFRKTRMRRRSIRYSITFRRSSTARK